MTAWQDIQNLAFFNVESLDFGRINLAVNNILNRTQEKDKVGCCNVYLAALMPLNSVEFVTVTIAVTGLCRQFAVIFDFNILCGVDALTAR